MLTSKNFFAVIILLFFSHQIFAQGLNFEFFKISNIRNGYTFQSNGSPQQLWIDPQNPEYLHTVFMNSQFKTDWPDRTCLYFGSADFGQSWFDLGSVPDTSRSGFPAIYGTINGAAIIINHSNYFGSPTRTGLFIDNGPFEYNFSAYDPGTQTPTIWPRCIRISEDKILIAATSQQTAGNIAFNTYDIPSETFSGWTLGPNSDPESFSLSVSNGGKIGFAYKVDDLTDAGDVFYIESTNNGINWTTPEKLFDCPAEQGIAVGAFRGIALNFYGESPCVVFETCQQDFSQFGGVYFPRLPNQILFWSPNINGGIATVIADSSNVPFAPNLYSLDVFAPLCRPVIGRAENGILFVAFSAATENVYIATDTLTYFAGYFMYSMDGGNTWLGGPQKFTPDSPLLDWKYISIAPVNPWIGNQLYVHLVLQADSLEAVPNPLLLSAQYYHSMAWIMSVGVDDDLISEKDFHLFQNYPNPFNPSTKMKYQLPVGGFVSLKVYDVLGKQIAVLVQEEKSTGSYDIEFNAIGLPSGIYFYTLKAANYIQTRKMILLK